MKVISLFDRSGVIVDPFAKAGFDVLTIDIEPAKHNYPSIQANIKDVEPQKADIIFAFPPCTHLAGSGARWWKDKGQEPLKKALELVDIARIWSSLAKYWLIENPVGRLSRCWRSPNWTFNPNEYAGYLAGDHQLQEQYTKRTCIWSNFTKPITKELPPVLGSKIIKLSYTAKYERSITPRGFSLAIYDHLIKKPMYQPPLFGGVV